MAVAETAELVASLELQDKFSKNAAGAERSMGRLEKKAGTLGKVGKQAGEGLGAAANNLKLIGVAGAALLASQVTLGVQSLAQLEEVKNQTDAVLKSTKGASKISAEAVRQQAQDLETLSTVDDKVIQAGENMLLTFKNIRNETGKGNDIFNQATKTLLDMSTAMGTEPKQAAIQLGKALNDPVKGITALTRVGVTFTKQQQDQIKALVKSGKTMEAQKIILRELNSEFGGSAEAFGKGPGATMRRFSDAMEDAQQALAKGFLPVIEKVSRRAQAMFSDPKVIRGIEDFGNKFGQLLDEAIDFGANLPWGAIGDAFKLMGSGARIAIDAFKSAPPWLQTAILTGWGLDKLTGGAVHKIAFSLVGDALSGTIGSLFKRGGTPATPLFVADVTGGGGVPGVPAGGGGGSALGTIGKFVLGPAAAVVIGAEIARAINEQTIAPAKDFETRKISAVLDSNDADKLQAGLDAINNQLNSSDTGEQVALIASRIPIIGDALANVAPELERQRDALQKKLDEVKREQALTSSVTAHSASEHNRVIRQSMIANSNRITGQIIRHAAGEHADARALEGVGRTTANRTSQAVERMRAVESVSRATAANTDAIRRKNFSPTVDVNVHNAFSISNIINAQKTYSYVTATGRVGGLIR